jgi:2-oxoglutarate ferredoxin oxidoreductase subunit beta
MEAVVKEVSRYYDPKVMPHIWCAGCGNGVITLAIMRAFTALNWDPNEIVLVSGIGCSSRLPFYVKVNTLHTTHGRALAFATGVKFGRPDFKMVIVTGDGDATAIGGNHFIHACRRNIDMTCILINNQTYGMTSGQFSPATGYGNFASSAPYGSIEHGFDLSNLALAAGASFVARSTVYHVEMLPKLIQKGFEHKGFSFIEILSSCPTYFGKYNKMGTPVQMFNYYKEIAINIKNLKENEKPPAGKVTIGVLHEEEKPEYIEEYEKMVIRAKARVS